ncbi:MAG: nicotinate (nicotinamide) nucleotide adenylyltransferase [Firmicutes bacterium]|nr:nicotinate (nicotinamide) nucleotide adenylyltransferase [Bacillota bacterium]
MDIITKKHRTIGFLLEGTVLFGGSFDPVQNAHVEIIKKLSERFAKVIVVPTGVSPFKKNGTAASGELRFKMLQKSLPKLINVTVSDFELQKNGPSFSYDTALYFKEEGPQAPLFFAVGSDMLKKLHTWSRFEGLNKLVTFYVIPRPGFAVKESILRKLKKLGARITVADFEGEDISSAKAKLDAAFDKFDSVPKAVKKIIEENDLYLWLQKVELGLFAFGLSEERVAHTYHTAVTAIALAKIHGVSTCDATLAALFHDIAKESSDEKLREFWRIPEPAQYLDAPAKVRHAFWGAEIVRTHFSEYAKKSIVDAVRFHSTGAPRMSKLAKIIYLADCIEPTRDAEMDEDLLKTLRALAVKDLNAAMAAALEASIRRILEKGRTVYPLTLAAHDYYTTKNEKRKMKNVGGDSLAHENLVGADGNPPASEELGVRSDQRRISQALGNQGLERYKKDSTKSVPLTAPHSSLITPHSLPKPLPNPESRTQNPDISDPHTLARIIAAALDEKKGRDIMLIHIAKKTVIADYFVIASALSTTAVRALTDYVDEILSKYYGVEPLRRDIDPKWAAIDYGSVILHIQEAELRKFYNLERLWSDGTNVEKV